MIQFWEISERGVIRPEINKVYEFLSAEGFRGETVEEWTELYKITDNFVERVSQVNVINYFRNILVNQKSSLYKKNKNTDYLFMCDVWEAFTKFRLARIFDPTNYVNFEKLEVKIKQHNSKQGFFYFRNCFVEVTAKGIVKHPYSKLDGFVYKENIIDKDFDLVHNIHSDGAKVAYPGGWSFLDFIKKLSQKSVYDAELKENIITFDDDKLLYLQKLIGFSIHDYKQQGDTDFAPVFCDDETGGSGKGILIQAIALLTNVCTINARKISLFDPKNMTKKTRVKVYTDVMKNFPFENAYTEITDFGSIMHKNGHEEIIPYKESYKVILTSNFTIRGNLGADRRRQRVFDVFPFFGENNEPKAYYNGINLFSVQWTDEDWNFFYTVMFICLQEWFKCNYKVQYDNTSYNLRKMEESYPMEFRTYIDKLSSGWHETNLLYDNFKKDGGNSPFVKKINSNFFGRLVTSYLAELKIPFHKNGNRTQIFIDKDAKPDASNTLPGSDNKDLPF